MKSNFKLFEMRFNEDQCCIFIRHHLLFRTTGKQQEIIKKFKFPLFLILMQKQNLKHIEFAERLKIY